MEEVKNTYPKIYAAIANVMGDCDPVLKDKTNREQGFKYRSVDDVFNALNPALAKNKVIIVPNVINRTCDLVGKTQKGKDMVKAVCTIEYTLFAEDGSNIKSTIIGEGIDTGDKATNKAMAVAYKYLCFQVFCIPTDELVDPDSECPEDKDQIKEPAKKQAKKSSAAKKQAEASEGEEKPSENDKITQQMINTIHAELNRTRVDEQQVLAMAGVKKVEDITVRGYKDIMEAFKLTPDYKGGN